jgi:DNA-binding Lrp family transcriptional regulator
MSSRTAQIARLLLSKAPLTQQIVAHELGIQPQSARNLLSKWSADGLIHRISLGVYISKWAKDEEKRALLAGIRLKVGPDLLLVGGSSWEHAGWAEDGPLCLATSVIPSKPIPKILGVELYPVGLKVFVNLLKKAVPGKTGGPHALDPVHQMLWWMEEGCPVTMPAPNRINWEKVRQSPVLAPAMRAKWPEFKKLQPEDIEGLYSMVHMDRLKGDIPGSAEPLDSPQELESETETAG